MPEPTSDTPETSQPKSKPERVAALMCAANHTTLWPADLMPYPTQCVIWMGGTSLCNKPLGDTGARFVREESTNA
jgi:hypothetical protein